MAVQSYAIDAMLVPIKHKTGGGKPKEPNTDIVLPVAVPASMGTNHRVEAQWQADVALMPACCLHQLDVGVMLA